MLDAGNGIYKADRFINNDKLAYLLLCHFHLDHIEGLHVFNKFNYSQRLCIYGQKSTRQILDTIIRLAEDADLLIAECAHQPGEQNPKWPYLNPQDAVQIARKANVKRLVLVHFDADRYRTLQDRPDAANSILDFDNLTAAYYDLILEI